MNGLIVTGGDINDQFVCDLIKGGAIEVIFGVDRGVDVLYRNHITPDVIVGDFDSANSEAVSYYKEMDQVLAIELNSQKDDTDTEHAIREAIQMGCESIVIVGCFGNRVDHMLSTISLLGVGLEYGVDICLMDTNNRVRMLCEGIKIKKSEAYGDFLSLIPFGGEVKGVTITGTKYTLENATIELCTSLGVSNEIVDDEAVISFTDGLLLLIESRD